MATKRIPSVPCEQRGRAERPSKSDWIELYRDLYVQTHGEDAAESAWLDDAERRLSLLRAQR
jgi:hypothetical protein